MNFRKNIPNEDWKEVFDLILDLVRLEQHTLSFQNLSNTII